ncbi:MAG: DUF1990 family protein [Kribbellaceae bacterium]
MDGWASICRLGAALDLVPCCTTGGLAAPRPLPDVRRVAGGPRHTAPARARGPRSPRSARATARRLGPLRIHEPVQVVPVVNEPDCKRFAYGSRTSHPVSGGGSVAVDRRTDGLVWLSVRSLPRSEWTLASELPAVALGKSGDLCAIPLGSL